MKHIIIIRELTSKLEAFVNTKPDMEHKAVVQITVVNHEDPSKTYSKKVTEWVYQEVASKLKEGEDYIEKIPEIQMVYWFIVTHHRVLNTVNCGVILSLPEKEWTGVKLNSIYESVHLFADVDEALYLKGLIELGNFKDQ